ncbi:MAG: tetratricopeptide repeat protein [Verrucomicrobiota bacterium]
MNDHGRLEAIIGYYNLDLFEEALEEMRSLPDDFRTRPELQAMETAIHIRQQNWDAALKLSRHLCTEIPDHPSPWLDTAYCLHELGQTAEAKIILLSGPDCLKDQAVYHYNMACYESQLENYDLARQYLDHACELDDEFIKLAANDPDLEPIV